MKIVVAIDDSSCSDEVVKTILEHRWPKDVQFKVVTVLEPLGRVAEVPSDVHDVRLSSAQKRCEDIRGKIESTVGDAVVHYDIREGNPHQEIIDAAVEWSADKIYVGAHGKDACPHFMLGSVSKAVANHAPCSVEIVRPKMHRKKHAAALAASCKHTSH